jgi:hypothetical protein
VEDSYVKIMKCKFCGKDANSIALHKQLRPIKGDVYDDEPCDNCKELFLTHKYFIGDCGHCGFIKTESIKQSVDNETFARLEKSKIFRMEKCFVCLSVHPISDFASL